jgi:L-arabinose isomerase
MSKANGLKYKLGSTDVLIELSAVHHMILNLNKTVEQVALAYDVDAQKIFNLLFKKKKATHDQIMQAFRHYDEGFSLFHSCVIGQVHPETFKDELRKRSKNRMAVKQYISREPSFLRFVEVTAP